MRSLAQVLSTLKAGDTIDLGDEELIGGFIRLPPKVTVLGGYIHNETRIYSSVGWTFSGTVFDGGDPTVKSSAVIAGLGGSDWTLRDVVVKGGGASGQIQVGLDLSNPDRSLGQRIPFRWTLDNCNANGAGSAWVYPQNDCLYILTTPGEDMQGRVIGGSYGPAPVGACIKVGGTGGNPMFEGACGVTLDGVSIVTGSKGPYDEKYGIALQGRTSGVVFRKCHSDGPVFIRSADGSESIFDRCLIPGRVIVSYYLPFWWLRVWPRWEVGPTGRSYTGVSWRS